MSFLTNLQGAAKTVVNLTARGSGFLAEGLDDVTSYLSKQDRNSVLGQAYRGTTKGNYRLGHQDYRSVVHDDEHRKKADEALADL